MRLILSSLLSLSLYCSASTLMLDFGSDTDSPSTNSPGHAHGGITDTTWNTMGVANVTSGLEYADGSAATGISVITGTESAAASNIIDFTTNPTKISSLGTGSNGTNSSFSGSTLFGSSANTPGTDGIFGEDNLANGIRIDGLAAGSYDMYVVGWNTNAPFDGQIMNVYTATGVSSNSFNFNSLSASGTSIIDNTATWQIGHNYVKATISLSAGESVFIANDITNFANDRGFLNSVQITAVPEPKSITLLLTSVSALALAFRKRK